MNLNRIERAGAWLALLTIVVMLGAAWIAGGSTAPFGPAADVQPPHPVYCEQTDVLGGCHE